jgi:3-phosphoshikimate 1-carboxyvinyltransferase
MKGTIELPGDKSISHRVALLAAIASDTCRINNFNTGADCTSTLRCLRQLGVLVKGNLEIHPSSMYTPSWPLDCGNSGTTIRIMTGFLAGQNLPAILTGDESLRKRPMNRVADPLRQMGARIQLRENDYAPLELLEGVKRPIEYTMPIASAQVKSAILFAGLRAAGTVVHEPIPTRDHTERMFEHCHVVPGKPVAPFEYLVPGDPSSAAFFVVAALMKPQSELLIRNVLLNPFRAYYLQKLQQAGADVQILEPRTLQNEPVADLRVRGGRTLKPIQITPQEVPSLIDEIPALSMLGPMCGFEVSGAKELRVKESDRIHAIVSNLKNLGLRAEETEDSFRIFPGRIIGGVARTFGDHRIAMAFAAAEIEVDNRECVKISFPEFFTILNSL